MNHLKLIHEYLHEKASVAELPTQGFPYITISRQAGAGGHLLAHLLTTDFAKQSGELFRGWHVFDRELCELVAQDPTLQTTLESLLAERYRSEFHGYLDSLFTGRSEQYLIYKRTFKIVHILAMLGKVIMVGRAGNCVTRDIPNGIRIRLVASEASRIRWMMKKFKLTRDEARKMVTRQDSERRKLLRDFFDKDIDDAGGYDAVFNSETVDPHEISAWIIDVLKSRQSKEAAAEKK